MYSFFSKIEDEGKQAYAIHWEPSPEAAYKWKYSKPKVPESLRIYECHVGISGSEPKVSTFEEFTKKVPPNVFIVFLLAILLCTHLSFSVAYQTSGPSSCEKSWIQCNPVDWCP